MPGLVEETIRDEHSSRTNCDLLHFCKPFAIAIVGFGGMLRQMAPNFCPCCGLPLAVNQAGESVPCCPVPPETEQKQREIWAEFGNARLLQSIDLARLVSTENGCFSLSEFLQNFQNSDFVWESAVKATSNALLQVVYVKGHGCKLLKWSFA